MAEISYRKELFVGRNSRAPDLASWPAGAFFTGNDVELGAPAAAPHPILIICETVAAA